MQPAVLFPDVEMWATGYLRAALAARSEPVTDGVKVGVKVPKQRPGRFVTVRRDGGPRLDVVREAARLGVNVWALTEKDASDLAALVRALLGASAGEGPVLRARELSGPSPIADESGQPRMFLVVELTVRGTRLT